MQKYYVSQWALLRKAEIIDLPEDFEIHPDYLKILNKDKIVSVVKNIRKMFMNMYQDIADYPERFKMPMIEIWEDELTPRGAPPAKARSSKWAPYRLLDVLINVLISGHIENSVLVVEDPEKVKEANKTQKMIKLVDYKLQNIEALYSQFDCYGLFLEGLKNEKFTKDTGRITLSYPDDSDFLTVLKWMADKAGNFNRRHDFMLCQYRLLQDGMDSLTYGFGADYIADRLHTKEEQDCVNKLDAALCEAGYAATQDEGTDIINGGSSGGSGNYSLFYCKNGKDNGKLDKTNFKVSSARTKLYLRIRTGKIQNGVEHIKQCSDEIRKIFIPGDKGCGNRPGCEGERLGGGQTYVIDGVSYWKCGCSTGKSILLQPRSEDIADYIRLAQLCN